MNEAAAPATPEAVAAEPAAELPTEAPAATGKQTDAARIAAAAKLLEDKEAANKPKDPGAAKKDGEPEAAAAKEPGDEDKPHDVTSAEWKEYRKRKDRVAKREAHLEQREREYADLNKKLVDWEAEKKLLDENPKEFWAKRAREKGGDFTKVYSTFADSYLDETKPEAVADKAARELAELKAEIAREREEAKQAQVAARRDRAIGDFMALATSAEKYPSTALTAKRHGQSTVVADGLAVGKALAKELGRAPVDQEIADRLDSEYEKYYSDLVANHPKFATPRSGVSEQVNGAGPPAQPVAPKAPRTLTNGGSAERAAPARKMTDHERIVAAAKLLP